MRISYNFRIEVLESTYLVVDDILGNGNLMHEVCIPHKIPRAYK